MSAAAWLDDPDHWPPKDPSVRRGLRNLCRRMTDLAESGGLQPDRMVSIRAGDLDDLTCLAQAALIAADHQLDEHGSAE